MGDSVWATVWDVTESGEVIALFQNGNKIEIENTPSRLTPGDHIWMDAENGEFIERVSHSGFDGGNVIGVIEETNNDRVLANVNGAIQKVRNPNDEPIDENYTVEIGEAYTIRSIVAEYPISEDPFERDNKARIENLRQDFEDVDEEDKPTFDDFGGATAQHQHLINRTRLLLQERDALVDVGAEIQMGALFYGSPGTGKTHFARILASQLDAVFYRVRGPEIVSKMVGDTEKLVVDIFEDARDHAPAIIFFDEIDSIASDRSNEGSREFSQRLVAQLLSVIDGFDKEEHSVFLIAATNQRDEIDKALLRPGRFSWQVQFPDPDRESRKDIFDALRSQYKISDAVSEEHVEEIIEMTQGWTGASLKALLNEAAVVCVEEGRDEIEYIDLRKGQERIDRQEGRGE
jgi:transitional endoplasmic reticulum ATPase